MTKKSTDSFEKKKRAATKRLIGEQFTPQSAGFLAGILCWMSTWPEARRDITMAVFTTIVEGRKI